MSSSIATGMTIEIDNCAYVTCVLDVSFAPTASATPETIQIHVYCSAVKLQI